MLTLTKVLIHLYIPYQVGAGHLFSTHVQSVTVLREAHLQPLLVVEMLGWPKTLEAIADSQGHRLRWHRVRHRDHGCILRPIEEQ